MVRIVRKQILQKKKHMSSTCFRTPQAMGSMWVIPRDTLRPTSTPAISACEESLYCIRWDGMHLVFRLRTMHSRIRCIPEWPEHIKESQRNWIGRSEGAEIDFKVGDRTVRVFTTRPDTLFGATYLVLAPEHPLVQEFAEESLNSKKIHTYVEAAANKSEIERTADGKEKSGVLLEGISGVNPANGETISVWVADYVLGYYGTGAVMAVPAHDARDLEFAQKYDLPVRQVVVPCAPDPQNPPQEGFSEVKRDTVVVHLRDRSTGKFALLDWHGTLEGITTAIMGGIEEGQTPEEAALMEIQEEA